MINALFRTFLEKPQDTCFEGQDKDENILYILRKSFITNFLWIFLVVFMIFAPFFLNPILISISGSNNLISASFRFVLTLFWYLFAFGFALQNFLNWFFNVYIITNKRVLDVDFKGIIYKNVSETPLENIEDVTSKISGSLRVIFNYGDVFIQTAAEKLEFDFEDVPEPGKVRDIISDLITELKEKKHL